MFSTQAEAKRFLIEKIEARAAMEGSPLADAERRMLSFSNAEPDLMGSEVVESAGPADDSEFESRIAGLLKRAYDADGERRNASGRLYREAYRKLAEGDHYLLIMAEQVLGRPSRSRVARAALFVALVMPGVLALLMAAALAWGLATSSLHSAQQGVSMVGVAVVLVGFGLYLIRLWRRESGA